VSPELERAACPSAASAREQNAGALGSPGGARRWSGERVEALVIVPLPGIEQLYRSHGPAVLRRARQLLDNDEEAQDVLQDVYASLLQRPEQFEGRSSIMTFLYAMTTNCALGRLRRRSTQRRLLQANHAGAEEPASAGPETLVQLRHWLVSLPEELAKVAVYYHLDEMTQDEIALVMGCSRQWVGKLLQRLREPACGSAEP
jgi:RNA polymerase sigma factor (sigma-70 family)